MIARSAKVFLDSSYFNIVISFVVIFYRLGKNIDVTNVLII